MKVLRHSSMHKRKPRGFALIEALVAFMILSVGLLGVVKLQSLVLTTGSDTKAKAQAIALVESRIDALRNRVLKSTSEKDTSNAAIANTSFDALLANGTNTETVTPAGGIHTFTVQTTISAATGTTEGKLIQVVVTWDDLLTNKLSSTTGSTQSVAGRTIVSWDDPSLGRAVSTGTVGGGASSAPALKTPTGVAERGDGSVDSACAGCNATNDGFNTRTRTLASGAVELRSSTGALLLTLPASTTTTQTQFATISGKVYVDKGINGFSQTSSDLSVRLSSEGICLYNNTNPTNVYNSSSTFNNSTLLYEYFSYICYLGEGWYGNVGIWNVSNQTPKICVGDPTFNSGSSDGTLISPHSVESSTRSYRGFVAKSGGGYLSTGILGGSTYPQSGRPQPSSYYSSYGISSGAANNYFNHDFLVTKSNQSCVTRMSAYTVNTGKFVRNAGQYFCINPDNDTTSADQCPSIWPGFESQVAGSGGTNYMLTVSMSGSGTVTSNPTAISCTTGSCSGSFASGTSVTLTATPDSGYVFSGWTGACTGTGTCTVSMSSDQSVTAVFTQSSAGTYQLGVTVNGTGTGTVTSAPSGISCSSGTCSASFTANDTVVLTAAPSGSSTFTGWGGACSGASSTCTVTMSAAQNVTATFTAAAPSTYTLSLTKSGAGSGSVTSVPSGISCGTSCTSTSYAFTTGQSVTLTASASTGSTFGGWGGACSGTSATCTVTMSAAKAVTATFYSSAACTTTYSGSVTTMPSNATNVNFTVTPTGGSCTNSNGTSNYSCSFSATGGTAITIRAQWKQPGSGNTIYYSGTLSQTADCATHTNVNIP